jgi:hypothetical protein
MCHGNWCQIKLHVFIFYLFVYVFCNNCFILLHASIIIMHVGLKGSCELNSAYVFIVYLYRKHLKVSSIRPRVIKHNWSTQLYENRQWNRCLNLSREFTSSLNHQPFTFISSCVLLYWLIKLMMWWYRLHRPFNGIKNIILL